MATMRVVVAYSPAPRAVDLTELSLPEGATVGDALAASGLATRHPGLDLAALKIGVWGKLRTLDAPLRDADRVEVYRPLKVDPKEARRQRYRSHREKTKGVAS
jgi:putative ubiquitin-RnfH superfamily antitoxin RatB of RatAB toxin-antitoxin module